MILSPSASPGAHGGRHPVVFDRRARDILALALCFAVPTLLALAISIEVPSRELPEVLGMIVILVGVVALIMSTRIELTVVLVGLYLGMLDGPIKLSAGSRELTAAIPDVLILAVGLGAIMRMVVRKQRIQLPAMSAWVLAFVGVVAIEAFNPRTRGILPVLGGFRQQLQFVPFFFFAYYLMRSKRRFRQLFLIAGVIALANGVVAAYQTELTPGQFAQWGPGYHNLVSTPEEAGGAARTYSAEGEARVRPPGLGSDAGFSGGAGQIALPFCLALFATSRRRKWVAAILALGSMLAVVVGLGRAQVIGCAIGVLSFAGLALLAGQRVGRTLLSLLVIGMIALPVGAIVVSTLRSGTFKRYETIEVGSSSTDVHKEGALTLIPHYIASAPFGFGLGSVGAVSSLGGKGGVPLLEGHGVSSETQYNLVVNELGAPGLVVWTALVFYMLGVIALGMHRVRDGDLAIMLAGMFAPFVVLFFTATSGAFINSAVAGPYFWFSIGVAAYWFAGPGRSSPLMVPRRRPGSPFELPAPMPSSP